MANGELSAPRAPRIFLDDRESVREGLVIVRGSSARRLARSLHLRRGDAVEVIHDRSLYHVGLTRVGEDVIEAEIRETCPLRPDPSPEVTLCPAIIRPQRFDLIIEKATELGVAGIQPVLATRSLATSPSRQRQARWRRLITEAAEQCRREQRPQLHEPVEVEALVAAPPAGGAVRIFASEREPSRRVAEALGMAAPPQRVQILVGPEGGFTVPEADAAIAHGWIPVTLSPRPLRPETAAVVATALVQEALRPGDQPAR
ncbi:MAG: RsmE family RNA methyltransferase [Dehalococcoidia bacterium]